MKWKLVSAFATGAVLASVIVYVAVRPLPEEVAPRPVPEAKRVEQVPPRPAPITSPAPVPVIPKQYVAKAQVHAPIREKPSPMPPPIRHEKPAVVAKYTPPPAPAPVHVELPQPEPAPAPVVSKPIPAEKVPVQNVSLPAPVAPVKAAPTVTLTAGSILAVRIGESLSSVRNQPGDTFLATLTQPLVGDGADGRWIIAERGARVEGRVVDTARGGRLKGDAQLEIAIERVALSDGQNLRISTEPYYKEGKPSKTNDDDDPLHAIIEALSRRKPAEIPVETRVSFKVRDSVKITEHVN
jgi:hypothetical protein